MKINKIILNNFGSYEGYTSFETKTDENRNIILIGGKNGAGKTTLFTAMRVCLYGYKSMGYKNYNSYYTKAITKLVNNNAKLIKPIKASVSMEIELENSQGVDLYLLQREWEIEDSLKENFIVEKNGNILPQEEVEDFEKYLLSLISPELFNLYFFDGEKIADFFINEGSGKRIKNAFLTLCGYDIFDIMKKNFKRISDNIDQKTSTMNEYLQVKEKLKEAEDNLENLELKIEKCTEDINDKENLILRLEKDYLGKGGITEEEWNNKLFRIKEIEKKRESNNTLLKKWANDVVPFIMLREEILNLKKQINIESKVFKYTNFCDVLDNIEISKMIDNVDELKKKVFSLFGSEDSLYLNLSLEQNSTVTSQINKILSFKNEKIAETKQEIKDCFVEVSKIKKEMEKSNKDLIQNYTENKLRLFEEKNKLLSIQIELEKALSIAKDELISCEDNFSKAQINLEEELKQSSINDISFRAILMLEKLQDNLYSKQVLKLEDFFRKNIKNLMRKKNFIDDISIDENFNIHLYQNKEFEIEKLKEIVMTNSELYLDSVLGKKAIQKLYFLTNSSQLEDVKKFVNSYDKLFINLPTEIDIETLSNGEKQIFIMTFYYSMINLCKYKIPFIIDTPFARIDTEHRQNISNYFFNELKGQVFILSTDEEVNSDHLKILKDKISATYLLENLENKKTTIIKNAYFEE